MSNHDSIEISTIFAIYWKRRSLWIGSMLICLILAVAYAYLAPEQYKAVTTILPSNEQESLQQLGMLQAFAGSFGLSTSGGTQRSDLFPNIIESRSVLDALFNAVYRDPVTGQTGDLYTWLEIDEIDPPAKRLEIAVRDFQRILEVYREPRTGIVRVEVTTPLNWLSAAIANQLVEELDKYNREKRISKAKENRVFISTQVAAAEDSLIRAEDRYKVFMERNVHISGSPELQLESARLKRVVEKYEKIYLELFAQLKAAEIDEFKDIPVISILDQARVPQLRYAPKRMLIVVAGVFIGLIIGFVIVFALDLLRHSSQQEGE